MGIRHTRGCGIKFVCKKSDLWKKKQGYFPCFTTNYTFMGIKFNEIIFGIGDTWKDGKIDGKIK